MKDIEVFKYVTELIQIAYQLCDLWSILNMEYYSVTKKNEWAIPVSFQVRKADNRCFYNVISY